VLEDTPSAVQLCKERTRHEVDRNRPVLKRTFEQGDYGSAARPVLSMRGICYPHQVPSVLDEHVLKPTSSADQRDTQLARYANNCVGRLRIAVWAAGPNDYGRPSADDSGGVTNLIGGHDPDVDGNPSSFRCVSERFEGRTVVWVLSRQIYQHGYDDAPHR
jgi:hypothetical protein